MAEAELIEPEICAGCGVLREAAAPACRTCDAAHGDSALAAVAQPGGGFWVAIRAQFTCSACRFESPLNHLSDDDAVMCLRCGIEQKFERSRWRTLCDFAHRVGDYGSGGPEGRFPDPEVEVLGHANEFGQLATHGGWAVDDGVRATPGNPLCGACNAPVRVAKRDGLLLEVVCTGCDTKRSYTRPEAMKIKRLAGVLAEEHEAGRDEVVLEEGNGVVVLHCPGCGAPLENASDADSIVVCGYCNVTCRVSARSHARAGHANTPAKTWWLYFNQPSSDRLARLNRAKQAKAKRDRQRAHAEKVTRERQQANANKESPPIPTSRPKRKKVPGRSAKRAEQKALIPLLATFAIAAVVGLAFLLLRPSQTTPTPSYRPGDEPLRRFSFTMSPDETGKLFEVPPKSDLTVELDPSGVAEKVRFYREGKSGPSHSITVFGGTAFDGDAALSRFREVAPNTLEKGPNAYQVGTGRMMLRLYPLNLPKLTVQTWRSDEAAIADIDALWSVSKFLLWGNPRPTAEALAVLNGPPLADAAKLDTTTTIEGAKKMFVETFKLGVCKSMTDGLSKKEELRCESDVDHPLVGTLHLAWPNGAGATLERATFAFRRHVTDASATAVKCLDAKLGKSEREVVDHASGEARHRWNIGSDVVTVEPHGVVAQRAETESTTPPTSPPEWAKRFGEIASALSGCNAKP